MFSSASSLSAEDRVWMDRAFVLAEQALQADEVYPSCTKQVFDTFLVEVPVGCVFVYEGMEIGSGRNRVNQTHDPTRHAEMVALEFMESSRNDIAEVRIMIDIPTSYSPLLFTYLFHQEVKSELSKEVNYSDSTVDLPLCHPRAMHNVCSSTIQYWSGQVGDSLFPLEMYNHVQDRVRGG